MEENFKTIKTLDPKMLNLLNIANNVSNSKATVLITGESGVGKELFARYIHTNSVRSKNIFMAVNCAALPENLLESELYGYEKGAFTGADSRKIGKFELANGGTFLLDEISELPLILQGKLLRVLQEGEIERVGGKSPIKIDIRLLATTNRSLQEMVKEGLFREDLYYRLNVVPLEIPPLRKRAKDIELLSDFFCHSSCTKNQISIKELSQSAKKKLSQWNWPGNIRELQNVIERSVLISSSQILNYEDILIENFQVQDIQKSLEYYPGVTVSQMEKSLILNTLEYTMQNRTKAAELLGISIRTLRNKINEYKEEGY